MKFNPDREWLDKWTESQKRDVQRIRDQADEWDRLREQLRQAEERAERAEERLATATQFKLAGDFVLFRTMSRQWCLVEARPIAKNPPAYFETIEEAFAAWEREKEQEPDRG
jgi:hypothetical protein